MAERRRMYRCEVFIQRTSSWLALDETVRPTTEAAYSRGVQRQYPILASRRWRIVVSDKKPARTMFTMTVHL